MSAIEQVAAALRQELPGEPQRAEVTFLGVEPISVLRFAGDDLITYVSLGCSRHPMTDPTDLVADPVAGPRAELVIRLRPTQATAGLHRTLATLAAAPAVESLVLTAGALIDLDQPLWTGASVTAVMLTADTLPAVPLTPPAEPVQFLRAIPITANEAALHRVKGREALEEQWLLAGTDLTDPRPR